MKTYDDIEGFIDYTNKEEWERYITDFVIPLWKITWIIKEYFEPKFNTSHITKAFIGLI